ncbi:MAG TPA: hypothetical protein VFJ14_06870 [Nocardioidaceae bacterium]|nr:hypothetical protein [Nocardioidaceae bacterium]
MRAAFEQARAHNVVSMSYFNSHQNSPDGSWKLDAGVEAVFTERLHHRAVVHPGEAPG